MKKDEGMRVLMACGPATNPYVEELCDELRAAGLDVEMGVRQFWLPEREFDVVHVQWPEALFEWQEPSWPQLRQLLEDVLPAWSRRARIVITRHNAESHRRRNREQWETLYRRIYQQVDGVVHLDAAGVESFRRELAGRDPRHAVIPNQISRKYGETLDQREARRRLGLPADRRVVLAFGSFRHEAERRLVLKASAALRRDRIMLVAPSLGEPVRPPRRQAARWLAWQLGYRARVLRGWYRVGNESVPDELVRSYFSAADLVVIPRIDTLNSGIIPLAFQFGRVTVGPDCGNIGSILRQSGNPTFDPAAPANLTAAIHAGLRLAAQGKGRENRRRADELWAPQVVAAKHAQFYREVLACARPRPAAEGHETATQS